MRRASSAVLLSKCQAPAHLSPDAILLDRSDDAGAFGDAIHDACACMVLGKEYGVGEVLARYNIPETERGRFLWQMRNAWDWWTAHQMEFTTDDGTLWVLDWKSTRLADADYRAQLWEYLYLGLMSRDVEPGLLVERELRYGNDNGHPDAMFVPSGKVERCRYCIIFMEDRTHFISGTAEEPWILPEEVLERHKAYVQAIVIWDGRTYNPGGHCWYCRRCAECPGLQRELANTISALRVANLEASLAKLTDSECTEAWPKFGMVIKFAERAREIIKMRCVAGGGILEGDEKNLQLFEQTRTKIKALEAWPVLKKRLTDEELAPAVKISKMVAMAAVKAKAPRGQKKRAADELLADLEAADAIGETTITVARLVPSLGAANEAMIKE